MGRTYCLLAVLLFAALLPYPAVLAEPIAGTPPHVTLMNEIATLENPSPAGTHYVAYMYPVGITNGNLTLLLALYSENRNDTIFILSKINITTGNYTQRILATLNGIPVQPLLLGNTTIIGTSGPNSITFYKVNTTSMEREIACSITTIGQPIATIMIPDGSTIYLYTVEKTQNNTRHYLIYRLDKDTLCPEDAPGVVPVEWTVSTSGDVLVWMGEEMVFPSDPWYRPVTLPVVERVDSTGEIVFALYSLIPRPSENLVIVRHAVIAPNGTIVSVKDYTFHGATWGRIYREQVSHSTALDPSTTLTIVLHDEDTTNKYIIVAGALGLLSVTTNNQVFEVSTGASAGTLGFFYTVSEGILYDSSGQPYSLAVETYSAVLLASRLNETTALLLVQGREYGYYTDATLILVRVEEQPPRTLWNTEQALEETVYHWTPPSPMPVETVTKSPGEAATTQPATSPGTIRKDNTTQRGMTEEGTGRQTILRPGDWAVYEGYIEYGDRKVEFSIRIKVESVNNTSIVITVTNIEFHGELGTQTLPLREGLQLEYRYGEAPTCIGYGLDIFSFWADPARLPEDGVIEGQQNGVEYRCVYDKQTGLLTEYYSSYELFGTQQTIYYKLKDSSITTAGGIPKYWYVIAALAAIVALVSVWFMLRARRRS